MNSAWVIMQMRYAQQGSENVPKGADMIISCVLLIGFVLEGVQRLELLTFAGG